MGNEYRLTFAQSFHEDGGYKEERHEFTATDNERAVQQAQKHLLDRAQKYNLPAIPIALEKIIKEEIAFAITTT